MENETKISRRGFLKITGIAGAATVLASGCGRRNDEVTAEVPEGQMTYRNLAGTPEECLEWHADYRAEDGALWTLDMIQIRKGSRYDGVFEKIAERIEAVLTPETRRTILHLKYAADETEHVMGIEYCRAVLEGGVSTPEEFRAWRRAHPVEGILEWSP